MVLDCLRQKFPVVDRPADKTGQLFKMDLLTFNEAAQLAGISVKTIQRHVGRGKLETVDSPMGKRIRKESLAPYVCLKKDNPGPEQSVQDLSGTVPDRRSRTTEDVSSTVGDIHGPVRTQADFVPLTAHLAALDLAKKAIEKADLRFEAQAKATEEHRSRAELAERQRMSLEFQLQQYQLALTEQSAVLAEARAEKAAAEARAKECAAFALQPAEVSPRVSTPKPSFGQRVKGWLGLKRAQ